MVRETSPGAVLETFQTGTSEDSLRRAFAEIKAHSSFQGLKLSVAIYSIKHSSKKPFLEETRGDFVDSLETYVGGAFTFAQESVKRFFDDHGETPLSEGAPKKGVCFAIRRAFKDNTNF
jgi:NAD(P)-dependent dehydrogenase (short-subunit alcohol dehydrogenase family)